MSNPAFSTPAKHGTDFPKSGERFSSMPTKWEMALLTIPQVGLMLCHLAISLTDLWVAGKIGPGAQASLGAVTQVYALLMLITSLACSGAMTTVSQSLGAGLPKRASRYSGLVLGVSLLAGGAVGSMGLLLFSPILNLLEISPEIRPIISTFIMAYCCQLPFNYAMTMLNSVFRAYRMMRLPLLALILAAGTNVLGSLGFGLGLWGLPNFGIAGVAWSTFGSTILGFSFNLFSALHHGIFGFRFLPPWRWNRRAMPYLIKVGVPSALGQLAGQTGGLVTLAILGSLEGNTTAIIAGMTLGARIQSVIAFPVGALGMSMIVLSGHLLGAGEIAGLYRLARNVAAGTGMVILIPAILLIIFGEPIAGTMTNDPEVLKQALLFLPFACAGIPLMSAGMMLNSVFSGAGATRLTFLIGCTTQWLLGIPLGYLLSRFYAASGVYAGGFMAHLAGFIWMILLFRSKKWLEYGLRKRHTGGN